MYGTPVTFTFRGEEKFTTIIGGLSTIIVWGIVILYTISQIRDVIKRENTSINSNVLSQSLLESTETYNPYKGGFRIGVGSNHLAGVDEDLLGYPTYLDAYFGHYQVKYDKIGGNKIVEKYEEIRPKEWGSDFFGLLDDTVVRNIGLNEMYCPATSNWTIGGSSTGIQYHFLEAKVKRWQLSVGWEDKTEIDTSLVGQSIIFGITNYYFDVEDYNKPVNVTVENEFEFFLIPGFTVEKELRVRVNKAVDYTNPWFSIGAKEYTYYSIETVAERLQPENNDDLLRVRIVLDNKHTLIERKVYTVYDMLGQVGGVMGIFFAAGSIFTNFFSANIYAMTLLSYFYKIKTHRVSIDNRIVPGNEPSEDVGVNNQRPNLDWYTTKKTFNEEAKGMTSRYFFLFWVKRTYDDFLLNESWTTKYSQDCLFHPLVDSLK